MSGLLWGIALTHVDQLNHEAKVQRLRHDMQHDMQRGQSPRPAHQPGRAHQPRQHPLSARVSTWAGYKMIGLGCRLVRPGLVAAARTRMSA